MKRQILYTLVCCIILQTAVLATLGSNSSVVQHTITLSDGLKKEGAYSQLPTRNVQITADGYIVTYTFEKTNVINDPLYEGRIMWNIAGFGVEDTPRKPALLYRLDSFTVPDGYDIDVKVIDSTYVDLKYSLSPARPPLTDSGNNIYTRENVPEIKAYKGFLPCSIASENNVSSYRGKKISNILVSPIQYDYERNVIRAYKVISYRVYFKKAETISKRKSINANIINKADSFLYNTTLNEPVQNSAIIDRKQANNKKGYLLLSASKFKVPVEKFAQWKRLLGFDVHTVLSDSWTANSVKEEVKRQYASNNNLYYLLIVGDNDDVPGQASSRNYSHVTDFYYSCLDGNDDQVPDLMFGRLPVSTETEAEIVVDKIINYERNPPCDDSFYKTGVNCAYFQDCDGGKDGYADRRFAQTSEEIRNALVAEGINVKRIYKTENDVTPMYWNNTIYSFGEPIPDELKKPNFPWTGNAANINEAINNGAFYVLHRDHGGVTGWGDPAYYINDIRTLDNENKLPVVFSMNCLTGKFDEDCFCEEFLKRPNGGCVAIIGATEKSYSGYNDALTEGMFDAVWPSSKLHPRFPGVNGTAATTPAPTYELGQILNQGMARLAETYGARSSYNTIYTKELFHCFGDPSMKMYTDVPTAFTDVSINRGDNSVSVNLGNVTATIAFYDMLSGDVVYTTGTTATYSTEHPANVSVCVSSHNKIPYINEGEIDIQNENVIGPASYSGSIIKIGSSVTKTKANGPVIFKSSNINLDAKEIIIDSDTTIDRDAEINISNK